MPSFEDMKKKYPSTPIGNQIKKMSNIVFDNTFSNNTTYRKGMIYDCNENAIEELEFKFIKTKTYTIDKDQVEYWVQFKTGVNPEIDYDTSPDKRHRLGYYIDILDDNSGEIEKWLIIGKDTSEFDRYNVLKCNYVFEWLDENRNYHKCFGCARNSQSYNSGIWSSDFTTTVEDQMAFIVPTNEDTKTIDYNIRFMITDNLIHPKVYEISKILDTVQLGIIKTNLVQCHLNKDTDVFYKINDGGILDDGQIHLICDYWQSPIKPVIPDDYKDEWFLSESNDKLYVNSYPQVIKALSETVNNSLYYEWHIFIDDKELISELDESYEPKDETFIENYNRCFGSDEDYYLHDYFDISINKENNTFTIAAINKDMVNYIVKIGIYGKPNENGSIGKEFDFVEMEVCV